MQFAVDDLSGYITSGEGVRGEYLYIDTRCVMRDLAKKFGIELGEKINVKVELKHFPGSQATFERIPHQDTGNGDYDYKHKESVVTFCDIGLKAAFGRIPRRFYVQVW